MTPTDNTWNLDVERAVLGVVLDGRAVDAWATVAQVCPHPGYFFHQPHQLIALVCMDLAAAGVRIDAAAVATLAARMGHNDAVRQVRDIIAMAETGLVARWAPVPIDPSLSMEASLLMALGGFNAVNEVVGPFASASALRKNCQHVAEHYRQRQLLRLIATAGQQLNAPKGASCVNAVVDLLINGAAKTQGQAVGDYDMGAAMAEAYNLGADRDPSATVARWGIPALDALVPLTPDAFVVMAAPPKCGKTSLALQTILATARGGPDGVFAPDSVAVVSREMSAPELARILIARELRIPANDVRDGLLSPSEAERVQRLAAEWQAGGAVTIQNDSDRVTVDDVAAWVRLRHLRAGGRLKLVVIDYLQLLDSANPKATEYMRISDATRRLKLLQRALRVPIILLSQLSRDGTRANRGKSGDLGLAPEPQLSDLRGSGSIEQDANAVVFLWPREKASGPVQAVSIKVAANRAGDVGVIDCDFLRADGQQFRARQKPATHSAAKLHAEVSADEDLFH
jgi:replicative DNA helicase